MKLPTAQQVLVTIFGIIASLYGYSVVKPTMAVAPIHAPSMASPPPQAQIRTPAPTQEPMTIQIPVIVVKGHSPEDFAAAVKEYREALTGYFNAWSKYLTTTTNSVDDRGQLEAGLKKLERHWRYAIENQFDVTCDSSGHVTDRSALAKAFAAAAKELEP